jgi:hypothetical protein
LKHPLSVHALTELTYHSQVKGPQARGGYPGTLTQFLARHPGATHGVFDDQGRLVYIGRESELRAAHKKG